LQAPFFSAAARVRGFRGNGSLSESTTLTVQTSSMPDWRIKSVHPKEKNVLNLTYLLPLDRPLPDWPVALPLVSWESIKALVASAELYLNV